MIYIRRCIECGKILDDDWDFDECEDCMNNFAASVVHTEDLYPDEEDLEW